MATYDITALGTALEFDTTASISKSIGKLPGLDRVVVAWLNSTNPYVQAFNVNTSTGAVTAIGSAVDIGTAGNEQNGISITIIDASNFIVFWNGSSDDGFCQLFSLDGTGNISANGSAVEFDTDNGQFHNSVLWDSTHILNIWAGTGSDGYAQIFTVNTGTGTITATGTKYEFDTANYRDGSLVKINSTKAVIFYVDTQVSLDGYARVLSVDTSTWAVSAGGATFEFADGASNIGNSATLISDGSPSVVANGYIDIALTDALIQTFSIDTSTWAITAFGSQLQLSSVGADGTRAITIQKLDSTHLIAWYAGASNDGYVRVLTYNPSTGDLTTTANEVEFDTSNFEDAVSVGFPDTSGFFVCAWQGATTDGFIRAFQVEMPSTLSTGNFFQFF
jgi:hypothetical protein